MTLKKIFGKKRKLLISINQLLSKKCGNLITKNDEIKRLDKEKSYQTVD
jgi:hypothetical protein